MKFRRMFLTVGGAVVMAATLPFAAAASAAPAATAAHASRPAAGISIVPLAQCPIVPHRFVTYRKGCVKIKGHLCTPGNQGNLTPPLYASNGCAYRVWLYPEKGEKGQPTLCVSPHTATGKFKRFWLSFRVTLNKKAC